MQNIKHFSATFPVDITAPVLSGISIAVGDGTADIDWSTDTDIGTAFWSDTGTSVADIDDIENGVGALDAGSIAISSSGAQTQLGRTGLTNDIERFFNIFHRDPRGNASLASSTAYTSTAITASLTYITTSDRPANINNSADDAPAIFSKAGTWVVGIPSINDTVANPAFSLSGDNVSAVVPLMGCRTACVLRVRAGQVQ